MNFEKEITVIINFSKDELKKFLRLIIIGKLIIMLLMIYIMFLMI